jgi:hypothetical protein
MISRMNALDALQRDVSVRQTAFERHLSSCVSRENALEDASTTPERFLADIRQDVS